MQDYKKYFFNTTIERKKAELFTFSANLSASVAILCQLVSTVTLPAWRYSPTNASRERLLICKKDAKKPQFIMQTIFCCIFAPIYET